MSQTPPSEPDHDPLERLLATARSALARHRKTHLTLAAVGDLGAGAHADIENLRESTSTTTPPQDLIDALRSPLGRQQVVNLTVQGKFVQAVVPSIGHPDLRVEHEVWRVIVRTTLGDTE